MIFDEEDDRAENRELWRDWLCLVILRGIAPLIVVTAMLMLAMFAMPSVAEEGQASIYTDHRVACPRQHYSRSAMAAAHKSLPCGTMVLVTNKRNGRSVTVRINDRGPYVRGRIIDLTPAAAREIDMIRAGVVPVRVDVQ